MTFVYEEASVTFWAEYATFVSVAISTFGAGVGSTSGSDGETGTGGANESATCGVIVTVSEIVCALGKGCVYVLSSPPSLPRWV